MLEIYNSLKRQKEVFEPLKKGQVRMYVCGPTVYDEPHIGHLRSVYVFEVMRNYLAKSSHKYEVTFVRNVTDIDDKIIEKARSSNGDLSLETKNVSTRFYSLYHENLIKFGIRDPDHEPWATKHIPDMIKFISGLIDRNIAYLSDGDVYYDVKKFPGYGKLSHQDTDAILKNVRIEKNEKKRNPLDFALWKKSKEGEPFWESPWSKGRPGWHIECSAMSQKYLGDVFDIHGGGLDLIFPHHENEIAQFEGLTGTNPVSYWVHHGLITVNGQKMSKSLKNFITLKTLEDKNPHAIEDLKMLFLLTHYSMPLDYSEEKMQMARAIRERFLNFFDKASQLTSKTKTELVSFGSDIERAMDNDFNTPQVLAVFHNMIDLAYARLIQHKQADLFLDTARKIRLFFEKVLCLDMDPAKLRVVDKELKQEIEEGIYQRDEAKRNKNFKLADKIRQKLLAKGILLTDLPGGKTEWRKL